MPAVVLASETDLDGWRSAARRLRLCEVPPEAVDWRVGDSLFAEELPEPPVGLAPFAAPRAFLALAEDVLLHADPGRFALMYRILWRLRDQPRLLEMVTDPDVARAGAMRKAVGQSIHKMHAYVRFRRVSDEEEETYVAWFEPPHHVLLRGADFFVKRMANLRFSILSPEVCVHWDRRSLSTTSGVDKAAAPAEDRLEDYWRDYYASIFNPARLNPKVMAGHMPKHYWRNLPEASLIPGLVQQAKARTAAMVGARSTEPSLRARKLAARRERDAPVDSGLPPESLDEIAAAVQICRRCDLWRNATQGVPGEGPGHAAMMFVGEQPGDQEDLSGHPFVGPAGQIFDRALAEVGVPRTETYVTNAVKHFKHEMRGKRRLHKTPDAGEVQACRWWLTNERRLIRPKVVVALGSTAARAVLGRPVSVMKERRQALPLEDGAKGLITVHPSFLLRVPDPDAKKAAYREFVADLAAAWRLVA
jgi:DNA polymerase